MPSLNPAAQESARFFARLHLDGIEVLYVYGTHLEHLYEAALPWLKKNPLHSLVLLEDKEDPPKKSQLDAKAKAILENDPQVAIHVLTPHLSELDEVVLPYSVYSFGIVFFEGGLLTDSAPSKRERFFEIKAMIAFFSDYHRASILGYSRGGIYFFHNYFKNLLKMPQAHPAKGLTGAFRAIPAIICGAGPSLDKNIEVLKTLQDRALLFAGSTSINALNAKGISPHIGVGIDPNKEQFIRLMMTQSYEVPFLYRNRIYPEALDLMHGDKLCVTGSGGFEIGAWVEERLGIGEKPQSEGYNVLNFALTQAYEMGCNPIIMVGVDLAYSQGGSYASGIPAHPLKEGNGYFQTRSSEEKVLGKKDIDGKPVATLWKWIRESLWYGLFADSHPDALLINATEGGIGFPGIENQTLAEVAAKYLVCHFDLAGLLHGAIQNSQWQETVQKNSIQKSRIMDLLAQLWASLRKCEEICQQIEGQLFSSSSSSTALGALIDDLHQEEAFKAMLCNIEKGYERFSSLERRRLEEKRGMLSQDEVGSRNKELDLKKYQLLKKSASCNALLLQTMIQDEKAKHKETQPEALANEPEDPQEIYTFEKQLLRLYDKELNLDYSEAFPAASYLDKQLVEYPDGSPKLIQFYQGVFLHGPSTFFSKKGHVLAKSWFLHGRRVGKMRTYFEEGQNHSVQRFWEGKQQGRQDFFYPSGIRKTVLNYDQGVLHGSVLLYHTNGALARELTFVKGKKEGKERMWSEEGLLQMEAAYRQDVPIGTSRQWYANGALASEVVYDDNAKKMSAHYWRQDGTPISQEAQEPALPFKFDQYTADLALSFEDVFSELLCLVPNLRGSQEKVKDHSLDLTDDLKELKQEMERLAALSRALKFNPSQEEALKQGLGEEYQDVLKTQVLLEHQKMRDQMQSIDHSLKDMLQKLQKNQNPSG